MARAYVAWCSGLAHALERVPALSWLGLVDSLAQFAHAVSAQVRLDAEGANLARLRANFAGCPHVSADFPAPRPEWVTAAVLVESFEGGRPLDAAVAAARAQAAAAAGRRAAAALHALHGAGGEAAPVEPVPALAAPLLAPHDARAVVRAGNETYLHMLLVHNFIHADLHPGSAYRAPSIRFLIMLALTHRAFRRHPAARAAGRAARAGACGRGHGG